MAIQDGCIDHQNFTNSVRSSDFSLDRLGYLNHILDMTSRKKFLRQFARQGRSLPELIKHLMMVTTQPPACFFSVINRRTNPSDHISSTSRCVKFYEMGCNYNPDRTPSLSPDPGWIALRPVSRFDVPAIRGGRHER